MEYPLTSYKLINYLCFSSRLLFIISLYSAVVRPYCPQSALSKKIFS